ncbi:hypothetical protein [Pontibacter populi]|uniref:DUF5723 domain-containing protein n=1 Tax=Pontibacter populi TaxID=890055 RepID=A0ABV1RZE4_9BACT
MKKLLVGLVLSGLMTPVAIAQELDHRPAQLSVVPGIGTNGIKSGNYYNTFSFNLLGGYNGGVQGLELGGILNMDKEFSKGVQMAGVANLVGGESAGVQMAGVVNVNAGGSSAVQMAGVANINKGWSSSSQFSGVLNVAGANGKGVQFSGVANVVNGSMHGFQAAGVINVAGEVKGSQLSGVINQAKAISGTQVGVLNIAGNSKAAQIGVINIADSANTTIGLINIVRKNGYYRGEIWAGETLYANAAFKMGTKNFYSLIAAGWQQKDSHYHLAYGFGIGSEFITRERSALNLDLIAYHLSKDELWTDESANNLYQTRLIWARSIAGNKSVLVGATFNVLHSEHAPVGADDEIGMDIAPWSTYNEVSHNRRIAMWPGLNIGFRF